MSFIATALLCVVIIYSSFLLSVLRKGCESLLQAFLGNSFILLMQRKVLRGAPVADADEVADLRHSDNFDGFNLGLTRHFVTSRLT